MDKKEFIEKLQHALAGGVNSGLVADNIRYYNDYIETEIRNGKTEAEVIAQLGDPRLLAKSIIEANKRAGESYGSNQEYDEEVANDTEAKKKNNGFEHGLILPGWLVMLIITVLTMVVIGISTALLSAIAPILIVGLLALLIVKTIQNYLK